VSKLHRRIAGVGDVHAQAMGAYHPWGTADTPMVQPVALMTYTEHGGSVEMLTPLVTANGAIIPASPPGYFGHVAMAGRS
jgi:hypothetical protein